ncbi:transcriptional regulator [Flavobacterium aurantiibacter]|nr:transcriptional regulator [Flavobacterium aurantiibacter]
MKSRVNKYQLRKETDAPHLGNFVQWHIEQNKILKRGVAEALQVIPSTFNQYFRQHSLQFTILWRISQALQHNFLMELGEKWLKIPYQTQKEIDLQNQLDQKNTEIDLLKAQLQVFREIHGVK